ncbi:MAG: GNAT family N-acetyltransferase [Candidatus Aenigmarchaeota archaeon]|nr:GNAT family N-acetyltransferase [Candidatus Aenigmarchaeota archaeon]
MKNDELKELINIYSDPYIKQISHDHREANIIVHPNVTYLAAKINNKIVGAFLAIKTNPTEIELHSLLTKKAIKHSRELGSLCIDWAFSFTEVQRVTANIIQGLEKAKNYCLKLGFVHEGTKRDALLKNGKLKDVYILGITRKQRRTT